MNAYSPEAPLPSAASSSVPPTASSHSAGTATSTSTAGTSATTAGRAAQPAQPAVPAACLACVSCAFSSFCHFLTYVAGMTAARSIRRVLMRLKAPKTSQVRRVNTLLSLYKFPLGVYLCRLKTWLQGPAQEHGPQPAQAACIVFPALLGPRRRLPDDARPYARVHRHILCLGF